MVTAFCRAEEVHERVICYAIIGKNPLKERIMSVDIIATFMCPVLQFSAKEVVFDIHQVPGSMLVYHTQQLGVKNVGMLSMTAVFSCPYPFCLMEDDIAYAQRVRHIVPSFSPFFLLPSIFYLTPFTVYPPPSLPLPPPSLPPCPLPSPSPLPPCPLSLPSLSRNSPWKLPMRQSSPSYMTPPTAGIKFPGLRIKDSQWNTSSTPRRYLDHIWVC
jgi:hypothetical protein